MATNNQVLVHYYVREGYYNKVQLVCDEELRSGRDDVLSFWKAYAQFCEGSTREAIIQTESIIDRRDMVAPAAAALVHYHNQCSVVDQDTVHQLSMRLQSEMPSASENAKALAAQFYTMAGEFDKAREVLLPLEGSASLSVMVARGWLEFYAGRQAAAAAPGKGGSAYLDKVITFFESAIGTGSELGNLDALMGKAKVLEGKRQWQQALDCLNKVIVMHSWYLPALIEKAKTLMMTADWDQALESASRIQQTESNNIEALRLNVLFLLSRESRCDAAAEKLQELFRAIQELEPRNHALVMSCTQLFSRLAGRHKAILSITSSMMKKVAEAAPNQAKYLTELGYQQMLQGDLAKAEQTFHEAVAKDETDVRALYGIIHCRVQEGNLDDAEEQLEFLSEIQVSVGKSPELAFLQSLLAWRKRRDVDGALNLLNETLTLHITAFKAAVGYDFFIKLNADFMLEIAKEYLQHTLGTPTATEGAKPGGYLLRGIQVLETLTRFVPGLVPAQVLLAKSKIALNDVDQATRILHQCLRLDPSCSDTYLLLARIYHEKEQPNAALQYLEQGLSHDFTVRNHPLYHLVKAQVLSAAGEMDAAAKVLQEAMNLPGVKTVGGGNAIHSSNSMVNISVSDRASIFTLLVNLLTKLKNLDEATQTIKHAIAEFAGTSEEVKVLVANSQLAIEKGEVDQALNMLRSMKPDHPQFAIAKAAMADIYMKHRKDKKQFARCYKAIVDHQPTVQNYLILGDALLSIQEPSDAIKAFQQAMEIDKGKGDPTLVQKIGKAMTQTHDYEKAIQYYHDALRRHPAQQELRQDLAKLYVRLQRWEDAIRELEEALQSVMDETFKSTKYKVDTLVQLAKVHREYADSRSSLTGSGSSAVPRCSECLRQARDLQNELLSQVRLEDEDVVRQLRQESAELNFQLGEYYEMRERNLEYAIGYYGETLRSDDAHEKSILALARIHLQKNELDVCEKQLMQLLRVDPTNEEASMLMAELMMMLASQGGRSDGGAQEYKDATFYYSTLLDKKPCNYNALSKLIFLLRRAGRLRDTPRYITAAEKACARSPDQEAGLRFCRGVYYRWMNKPQDALMELNYARRDPDYRAEALTHMIEIYLNPDPNSGLEALDSSAEPQEGHLREVENLIKELSVAQKQAWNPRLKVYQCQSLMFTKNKANVERALTQLMDLYNDKKDYVPALLAMSQGLIIQKQVTKARNQLKRIADSAKKAYNPDFMDDFERAWLLLAEIYIQSSKYDLASSLCHLAKDHNRSCGKAWEQLGLIYEKEQAYKDAASHYEKAWEFCNETSPAVGYRLGFNYLKAKRYVEAINICQQVLKISENYPKIKKDVLDKARQMLRS
jgi:tetratricopeptide repeat protein 21B